MYGITVAALVIALQCSNTIIVVPGDCDIGAVAALSKRRVEFVCTNTEDATVTITGLKSGCSCASLDVDKRVLSPGESATIRATIEFGEAVGPRAVDVIIFTDSREFPQVPIRIKYNTKADLTITPKAVVFPRSLVDDPTQKALLLIRGRNLAAVNTKDVSVSDHAFKVTVLKGDDAFWADGVEILVEHCRTDRPGQKVGKIEVRLASSTRDVTTLTIPVFADTLDWCTTLGASGAFGATNVGRERQEFLPLLLNCDATLKEIRATEVDGGSLEADVRKDAAGRLLGLLVGIFPTRQGMIRGKISVELVSPTRGHRLVDLPIRCYAVD